MNYQPYQQRVVEEKESLDEKITKLLFFIEDVLSFRTLPKAEQARLVEQSDVMLHYSEILRERILSFPQGE